MEVTLLENIRRQVFLTEDQQVLLESYFQPKSLKKKHYLLQEGEVNLGLAFVTSGILRSFTIDSNGFEHVLQFAPADWWMADMYSLTRQEPARLFIEALEPTGYLWITKPQLDEAFEKIPALERHFRILAENAVIAYQNRIIGNLSQPAIERYAAFCQQYPTLIQCLPQKQIASFIGVTPEFFSKMINTIPMH